MSAWITDRLPTEGDGDYVGLVWVQLPDGGIKRANYYYIHAGTPWQPITYPEPYVKPKVWMVNTAGVYKNRTMVYWDELTKEHFDAMTDALNRLEEVL